MRKLWLFPFSVLIALVFLTQLAYAATGGSASDPALAQVIDWAIRLVGTLLITLVTGMAGLLLVYVKKRWHINISAAKEQALDAILAAGIHMAEEKSHNYLKAHEQALSQEQKREEALNYVLQFVHGQGWDEYGADWLNQKLHAKLGEMRAKGEKSSSKSSKLPLRPPPLTPAPKAA